MDFDTFVPPELCYISKPFLIRPFCVELPVQKVLGSVLRIFRSPCTAVVAVFDRGLDPLCPANAQSPFIVDMDTMIMPEFIIDAAISLVWTFRVNLFNFLCNRLVLNRSGTQLAGCPLMVRRSCNMQKFAGILDWKTFL